jgi:hypothetical protein
MVLGRLAALLSEGAREDAIGKPKDENNSVAGRIF